jgi:nicotinamidase-related amidase
MLNPDQVLLVVIDLQAKLASVMHEKESLLDNARRLVLGARALQVPILLLEQNPERMGPTAPEISQALDGEPPIPKMSMSACGEAAFMNRLNQSGRRQILLTGIEAHVCVYMTALDLISRGFEVEVVADATASRSPVNKALAMDRIRTAGGGVTCVETALFEIVGTARHPAFKEILRIVR